MKISELIDMFVAAKAEKEALAEQAKKINERMATIEADIMALMSATGITQAASDKASCTMSEKKHPAIEDWNVFYAYVAETKQFELLHKRLSSPVFRDMWEAGEHIPGTKSTSVWELSVRRK
jgi:hypothetical protein